jgi:hypothetical protein
MMKPFSPPRLFRAALAVAFLAIPFSAALGASAAHPAMDAVTATSETMLQSKKDEYYKQVWAKLMAAVKAEKMTLAEAKAKMAAIMKAQGEKKSLTKKDLAAIAKKLKAAVAANKLTEAEAKAKWKAILKKWKASQKGKDSGKKMSTKEYLAAVKKKLDAAVKANKMTQAEAQAKWDAILAKLKSK